MKWGQITVKKSDIAKSSLAKSFLRIKASFVRSLVKQLIQVFREDPIFDLDTGKSKSTTRSNRCCLELCIFIFLCFVLVDDDASHLHHFYIYLYTSFILSSRYSWKYHFWKYNCFINFCFDQYNFSFSLLKLKFFYLILFFFFLLRKIVTRNRNSYKVVIN